jgi:hypothetical protein
VLVKRYPLPLMIAGEDIGGKFQRRRRKIA